MAGILTAQNPFLIFFFRLCPHFSEVEILIYLWRLTHSVLFFYWKVNLFTSTQFKTGVNIYVFSILLLKEEGPFSFISQIQKCLVFYVNRTTLPYHEDCQWCLREDYNVWCRLFHTKLLSIFMNIPMKNWVKETYCISF